MTLIEYFIVLVRVLKIKWDNIAHHLAQDGRGNAGSTLLIFLYTVWCMPYFLQGCFVHIVLIFRVCFIIFCAVVTIFSFCKTAEAVRIFTSYLYVLGSWGISSKTHLWHPWIHPYFGRLSNWSVSGVLYKFKNLTACFKIVIKYPLS